MLSQKLYEISQNSSSEQLSPAFVICKACFLFDCLILLSIEFIISLEFIITNYRSIHPEAFCKIGVIENFTRFTGKHQCRASFFYEVAS